MPDMSNTAVAIPLRNRRGRPPKSVMRPVCPEGHSGRVVLDAGGIRKVEADAEQREVVHQLEPQLQSAHAD